MYGSYVLFVYLLPYKLDILREMEEHFRLENVNHYLNFRFRKCWKGNKRAIKLTDIWKLNLLKIMIWTFIFNRIKTQIVEIFALIISQSENICFGMPLLQAAYISYAKSCVFFCLFSVLTQDKGCTNNILATYLNDENCCIISQVGASTRRETLIVKDDTNKAFRGKRSNFIKQCYLYN